MKPPLLKHPAPRLPDLIWAAGIVLSFIPFIFQWEFGGIGQLRLGSGSFGVNFLRGIGLFALTSILWGGLGKGLGWCYRARPASRLFTWLYFAALCLLCLFWANQTSPPDHPLLIYCIAWLTGMATVSFVSLSEKPDKRSINTTLEVFRQKKEWNALFYALLLFLLVAHNVTLVWQSPDIQGLHKVSACIGRMATQGTLVTLAFFLIRLIKSSGPGFLKWVVWAIAGIAPALIIGDLLVSLYWNKSLLSFFNSLTDSGMLDVTTELRATGTGIETPVAYSIVVGGSLLSALLSIALWRISHRHGCTIALKTMVFAGITALAITSAEQLAGKWWKGQSLWKEERALFDIHLSPIRPSRYLAHFDVTFQDPPELDSLQPGPSTENRPDIHLIMVETLRSDALSAELTPALHHFRTSEAQAIRQSFAVSNGTHLSWFSLFHSRIPTFWTQAMEQLENKSFRGAPPLQILKNAGYEIQVRAACELDYKAMGPLNFGKEFYLVDHLTQAVEGSRFEEQPTARRDEHNIQSVISQWKDSSSPRFYFTALDSPHYNYTWGETFTPPLSEFDEPIVLSPRPSQQELERVKNRYLNSVAWVDSLIQSYLDQLKATGRYDESIVIITGDHGEEFQERGGWFHTSSLEAEQTEVPLLIKWPSSFGRGPRQETASHLDLMPSLLDFLGFKHDHLIGHSLLQALPSRTILRTTAYPGKSLECMRLTRGAYDAAFYWPRYWEADCPPQIKLLRFDGPDGAVQASGNSGYRQALEKAFPDHHRFFHFSPVN